MNLTELAHATALVLVPILLVALAAYTTARALGWKPVKAKRPVLVYLASGETLQGVLVARHATYLELARVEVLSGGGGTSSTVDGKIEVDRSNVIWVQVP